MKNTIITTMFIGLFSLAALHAQPTDHSFSYQGELLDGGNPANGTYDFKVQMLDSNGLDVGTASMHEDTQVTNGLFNLDVKIGGINYFSGDQDYFFEIGIRPGTSTGAFDVLNDVQTLQAVPLATNLTNNNAIAGQVLAFNGATWTPTTYFSSPWASSGNDISYVSGKVGIGTNNPFNVLHVKSTSANTAIFEGADQMYVSFVEAGTDIGYIGSFVSNSSSSVGAVNTEDFEIGTHSSNNIGSVHITIKNDPALTVLSNKNVSIGTTVPYTNHKLTIKSGSDNKALRLSGSQGSFGVEYGAKLNFGDNDYAYIGEVQDDELTISAYKGVKILSNVSGSANMKPYVYGQINSTATITTSASSTGFSVAKIATGHYRITFDDATINSNYTITATARSSSPKFATAVGGNDAADIYIWTASGVASDHAFNFVVYRR